MKNSILFLSLFLGLTAEAQHDLQFSQTLSNLAFINPAANGLANVGMISTGNRTQWMGVDGRPSTSFLSFNSKLKTSNAIALEEFTPDRKSFFTTSERSIEKKHSVGARLYNDQIGPFKRTAVHGSYAYHLPISKTINVSAGLEIGWSGFTIDETKVSLQSAGDNAYLNYMSMGNRQRFFDASAGIMVYHKKWLVGFSSTQLTNASTVFENIETMSNYARHFYGIGSYSMTINSTLQLEPYVLSKWSKGSPFTTDFGVRTHYSSIGFVSLGYRLNSAVAAGFGINAFKQFQLVYNFDMNVGSTQQFIGNTHEIQLTYLFGHKRRLNQEFEKEKREEEQRKKQNEEDQ